MEPIYTYFDLINAADVESLVANADAAARGLAECGEPKDAERRIAIEGYEESFIVRMTHGSASIEGSTLTLAETALVLDHEFVPSNHKQRDDMMSSIGIADAYRYAMRQAKEGRIFDRSLMQDIHERVSIDMDDSVRGILRTIPVYIRGSMTVPPDPMKVRTLLDDLAFLCSNPDLHPLVGVAATHKAFESIHPFVDGNGRTGRALMNFQLVASGYPPIAIGADRRGDYLSALEEWDVSHDPKPLISLICEQVVSESENRMAILAPSINEAPKQDPHDRAAPNADKGGI